MRTILKLSCRVRNTAKWLLLAGLLLARPCAALGPPPIIVVQPLDVSVLFLSTASLTVVALSGTTMTYQWLKNGTNIPGATSATYSLLSIQNSDQGNYAVVVQNGGGSVTSSTVTVTVLSAPTIGVPPLSQAVAAGQNVSLSTVATGSGTLSYQWTFNGSHLSGATGSTLTLSNVQTSQAGNYTVVVSNSYGSVTSSVATLTVTIPNFSLSPSLGAVAGLASNGFNLQFPVPVGSKYIIFASTDLKTWTPIATNVATSASAAFADAEAVNYSRRYYRVAVQ